MPLCPRRRPLLAVRGILCPPLLLRRRHLRRRHLRRRPRSVVPTRLRPHLRHQCRCFCRARPRACRRTGRSSQASWSGAARVPWLRVAMARCLAIRPWQARAPSGSGGDRSRAARAARTTTGTFLDPAARSADPEGAVASRPPRQRGRRPEARPRPVLLVLLPGLTTRRCRVARTALGPVAPGMAPDWMGRRWRHRPTRCAGRARRRA